MSSTDGGSRQGNVSSGPFSAVQAALPAVFSQVSPGQFTAVQTILPILALLWSLLLSGEQVTNVQGRIFPRQTRVLLYLGYAIGVSSALLYLSSLREHGIDAPITTAVESIEWPVLGLLFLGIPMVVVSFMVGLGCWLDGRAEVETPG
jgi:hypothetical protein